MIVIITVRLPLCRCRRVISPFILFIFHFCSQLFHPVTWDAFVELRTPGRGTGIHACMTAEISIPTDSRATSLEFHGRGRGHGHGQGRAMDLDT